MSDVVEKDVREIKYRVEAIEKSVDLLVRANRKEIIEDLLGFFGKSSERVNVFLAVDGERSVTQIATALKLKVQNASRRMGELEKAGLISVRKTSGPAKVYEKAEKAGALNLEKILEKQVTKARDALESVHPPEDFSNDNESGRNEVSP